MRLKWIPFSLFFLFVVGIIVADDLGRLQTIIHWVGSFPLGDKWGHFIMIGTLTFLLNHALDGRMLKIGGRKVLLGCAVVTVGMTLEEFSQIWIPSRTFDLVDLSANYLGICLAGWIWLRRNSARQPRS
jgi:polysaccharide biosynthesis protein VpsQ